MDRLALPDHELAIPRENGTLQRHFQGYSTHAACDLLGIGVSSIGKVHNTYSQSVKELSQYYARIDADLLPIMRGYTLSEDDQLRREVILDLMCQERIDFARFEERYGIDFRSYFADALEQLAEPVADGLVAIHDDEVVLLPEGKLMLRNVAMAFDAYLGAKQKGNFSRTV